MTFRRRITLIFATLGLLAQLGVMLLSLVQTGNALQDGFIRHCEEVVLLLTEALSDHFEHGERATLDRLAAFAIQIDEVAGVEVRDLEGHVVMTAGDTATRVRLPWYAVYDDDFAFLQDHPRLGVTMTVEAVHDGAPVGVVTVVPDFHELTRVLFINALEVAAIALATMLGMIALGRLGASLLVDRLEQLDKGAARIAAGDFSYRLSVGGRDEIHRTAQTLNRMADALTAEREALVMQARRDALTGLLNRAGLALAFAQTAGRGQGLSALHIDLDRFKMINDTRGHSAGDAVLAAIAARLERDAPEDALVARIGGDEFAMILREDSLGERSVEIAERCIAAASRPVEFRGMKLAVGASVGIAHLPPEARDRDADRLLSDADIALYQAKETGRGRVALFDGRARALREAQAGMEFDLALALEYNEFVPFLQPQIDVDSGAVIGAEVLARWQSRKRGLLTPGDFLKPLRHPELEERITYAVRAAALDWMAAGDDGRPPAVSLNFSAMELARVDCAADLDWELAKRGLAARKVAIEVLEDVVIRDGDTELERTLAALRKAGHALELDDFGTGNSGLVNLVRLKVEQLKIDRSFVSGIDRDRSRQAIVEAMIGVGQSLDIKVLAEGVETEAEMAMLRKLGCRRMQGFHFARPMSTAAFESWIRGRSIAA